MTLLGWVAIGLVVVGVGLLAQPLSLRGLESRPSPVGTYDKALSRLEELRHEEDERIAAECRSELMTHGRRTGRVIVLLHGLTNCPAQFDSLGRMLFARGANVLIPRLPRHGRSDRMTTELAWIDARELCVFTDRVIDIAHGLGDTITVAGLSISGSMAAWAGQFREDVHRAVPIAPMIGAPYVPSWADAPFTRLALMLPNRFFWWDPKRREQVRGPKHVYPRFSTRSVGASVWIGLVTKDRARRARPGADVLAMVTVGGDRAVDNGLAIELVREWRRHGATVETYEFPEKLRLNHDVVDPEQVGGNPAVTYPRLLALIDP